MAHRLMWTATVITVSAVALTFQETLQAGLIAIGAILLPELWLVIRFLVIHPGWLMLIGLVSVLGGLIALQRLLGIKE
ncbi:MAG: hypothetical protein HY975_00240 [Candidatus Kerfeldbacteria bacterium]|nr:hypothetical protein [Candidatus Kerfeldbacteria bacterium]